MYVLSSAPTTEAGSVEGRQSDLEKDNGDIQPFSPTDQDVADVVLEQLISNDRQECEVEAFLS